jgi:hypothetical protein
LLLAAFSGAATTALAQEPAETAPPSREGETAAPPAPADAVAPGPAATEPATASGAEAAQPQAAAVEAEDATPQSLPGSCPLPASRGIDDALARSDAGDAAGDLDLAACYRELGQPYPEQVALARALERGLPEAEAEAVRARLEDLGAAPPPSGPLAAAPDAGVPEARRRARAASAEGGWSPVLPYALAGLAVGGLLAGTATGLVALHEEAEAERDIAGGGDGTTLGIAAAVCAGAGIAAGVAALVLWPDEETGPTAGPGDMGLGWQVRF